MSVTAARGFTAAGVAAGIKPGAKDLAIIVADESSVAAGVFTRNQAAAAPVDLSRASLNGGSTKRAIVVNSGCANAATGAVGMTNAKSMAETLAAGLGCDSDEILVCSTGTIGPQLPMDSVVPGIEAAVAAMEASPDASAAAAEAIMTTDSVPKQAVAQRDGWVVGGMAKGSGMVRPDMATMLAFVTTDAVAEPEVLADSLKMATDVSFNSLNIDGCESTNDSVIAMASGAAGIEPDPMQLAAAIEDVCRELALQMAADAEGATRVVIIDISGAANDDEARSLGRHVTDSALVRSSFYGGDVNWGRILGALGSSGSPIDPSTITISYEGVPVFTQGSPALFDEAALLARIETGDFGISINLGSGTGGARIVTTDLSPEYVIFNGERS